MKIQIQNKDSSKLIVKPFGSLDSESATEFGARVQTVLGRNTKVIIMDFSELQFISSAGLGELFGIQKKIALSGGKLLFSNLSPAIQKIFEIVKALPKDQLFTSVEEADQYFYKIMQDEIKKTGPQKK